MNAKLVENGEIFFDHEGKALAARTISGDWRQSKGKVREKKSATGLIVGFQPKDSPASQSPCGG